MSPRTKTKTNRQLLDLAGAADYLGVPVRTMRKFHETRQVAHVRLGARVLRFHPDDLDAYIAARTVPARRSA